MDKMALMDVQGRRVSYADLAQMPEDGRRYELYDGEVFCGSISDSATSSCRGCVSGASWTTTPPSLVALPSSAPSTLCSPSMTSSSPIVVFLTAESLRTVSLDAPIRRSPDLAVEVLSPSTASNDRGRKTADVSAVRRARVLDRRSRAGND